MDIKAIFGQLKIHVLMQAHELINYEDDDQKHLTLVQAAVALNDPKVDELLERLAIECQYLKVSDSVCRLMSQWWSQRQHLSDFYNWG